LGGARERDIAAYVGRPVEIAGRIVGGDQTPRPVGTSGRLPATEVNRRDPQQPTGAVTDPKTGRGFPPGVPSAEKRPAPRRDMGRLNVASFRPLPGDCE
jgi:hypothetical protein